MFKAPDQHENTPPLRHDQLAHYISERDTLIYQMREIEAFHAYRSQVREQATNFHLTICNTHSRAIKDYENRTVTAELARTKVLADNFMRQNQSGLIESQLHGLRDIQCMRETMRLRGVALLRDISTGMDRGLSAELNNQTFSDLKERDKKIEWIIARSDAMNIWHREAKAAQAELATWDRRIEIAHAAAKVVVVVGLSFVPGVGPGGAFLVATTWNVADKGFKMAYNGLSPREALRQFAIELVLDAAFAGMSAFKAVRVVAQPGAAAAKEGVKQEGKTVFVRSLFNAPAKFEDAAGRHTLIHKIDIFRGAEGKLTNTAFKMAERILQNHRVLAPTVVAEIRGSLLNGGRLLAYVPLPFLTNSSALSRPATQPTRNTPPNDGPGMAGGTVKPVVVPPNEPLQTAATLPSEKERQELAALVQKLGAAFENLVPSIRDSATERLKDVERMLEDKGWSLAEIRRAIESIPLQTTIPSSPAEAKPAPEKSDFVRWLESGNLYAGIFDFLNTYNPWTDLLAGLGRVQASSIPLNPPPYFPPPLKPPHAPESKRTSGDEPPDHGLAYGTRLRLDDGDGNSYTRYRNSSDQENVVRMYKHDPLSTMHGLPNQTARMAAEVLDARAKTQLLLAAEASQLAMQQAQQLAQGSVATNNLQRDQSQQEAHRHQHVESQQRAVALEQAHKAMARLVLTEQSTLSATQEAPRMADLTARQAGDSSAASPSKAQANATRTGRSPSRREEAELTALAALQGGEAHAQLQRPLARIKRGSDPLQSSSVQSQATSLDAHANTTRLNPSLLAQTSISELPRLRHSKEPSHSTEESVAAHERSSRDPAQVISQTEEPRSMQQHSQIHVEGSAQARSFSSSAPVLELSEQSTWGMPSTVSQPEALVNDDVDAANDGVRDKAARKARKDKLRRDALLRQGIIQQLLTQDFDTSKREKLLAVLIKLGISEKEYRELVARVGEQEAHRMAERSEHEQRFKDAQKIAVTTSGELVAESLMAAHSAQEEKAEQQSVREEPKQTALSRADLYRSLQRGKGTSDM
jgi:hypothetical protein